jgi:hypothetical protein
VVTRSHVGMCAVALVFAACSSRDSASAFSAATAEHAVAAAGNVSHAELVADVAGMVRARGSEPAAVSPYLNEPYTHLASATFVADGFARLGYTPVLERLSVPPNVELTNVYVDIPGNARADEVVLVTGHHDAYFTAGADDNGSAMAVLLQAARILKDTSPQRTIRLLAFDREEEGLVGSELYAAQHAPEKVRVVINMDCVGFASHAAGSQELPTGVQVRDVGDFLAVITNEASVQEASKLLQLAPRMAKPVDVIGLVVPGDARYPGTRDFIRSDHAPFWKRGTHAVFLTDTANFRNHNYHKPTDLPETLDYAFLERVAQLVVGASLAFADEP